MQQCHSPPFFIVRDALAITTHLLNPYLLSFSLHKCFPYPPSDGSPLPIPLYLSSPPSIPTLLYPALLPPNPGEASSQPTSPATTSLLTLNVPHSLHPHHHHVSLANNLSPIPLNHGCLSFPCAP